MYSGCYLATGICTAISLGNPDPQSVTVLPSSTQEFGWTEYDDGPYFGSAVNLIHGILLADMTRKNGDRFRKIVLSRGNTESYNEMFKKLVNHSPNVLPMIEELGLLKK